MLLWGSLRLWRLTSNETHLRYGRNRCVEVSQRMVPGERICRHHRAIKSSASMAKSEGGPHRAQRAGIMIAYLLQSAVADRWNSL